MQQVNDNMDDLFKKAAHHYPLNTKSSDWNSFKEQLEKELSLPEQYPYRAKNVFSLSRKWSAVAILLTLPLAVAVTKVNNTANGIAIAGSGKLNLNDENALSKQATNTIQTSIEKNTKKFDRPLTAGVFKAGASHDPMNNESSLPFLISPPPHYQDGESDIVEHELPDNFGIIGLEEKTDVAEAKNGNQKGEMAVPNSTPSQKPLRFYLGAVVAAEYTRVKNQQFTKPGANFGILAGYQLNRHFSVELGVLLAKKYYYTNGKYVQENSLRADGSDITSVNAYNSITELPFMVKYNFEQKKNGGFFASAGAVSYVMHKEHYNYSYDADGQNKHGVKNINSSSNYYFSNLQLSAGYEHGISKNSVVRIEPYYRIPLGGIGASDLPVTSIGLNIALTTKIK